MRGPELLSYSPTAVAPSKAPVLHSGLQRGAPGDRHELAADRAADHVALLGAPAKGLDPLPTNAAAARHDFSNVRAYPEASGEALPSAARAALEPRFGYDFGRVRVHTGGAAAESARALSARAYTVGSDIVFGAGQYSPGSVAGQRLIAHELAHVVQQRGGARPALQLAPLSQFNDHDPLHDPSRLTDAQIRGCDEFPILSAFVVPPATTPYATAGEVLLACRLMLRAMREAGMPAITMMPQARAFLDRAKRQLGTLAMTVSQVGDLQWVPFDTWAAVNNPSALPTEFGRWVLAGGPQPSATVGRVNCWEMVLFGAFRAGHLTFARIQSIYTSAVANVRSGAATLVGETVEAMLRQGRDNILDLSNPSTPEPLPGDLVIFRDAPTHVAISMGTKTAAGDHEVISLWSEPGHISTVQRTTVEAILAVMVAGGGRPVHFFSPAWGP